MVRQRSILVRGAAPEQQVRCDSACHDGRRPLSITPRADRQASSHHGRAVRGDQGTTRRILPGRVQGPRRGDRHRRTHPVGSHRRLNRGSTAGDNLRSRKDQSASKRRPRAGVNPPRRQPQRAARRSSVCPPRRHHLPHLCRLRRRVYPPARPARRHAGRAPLRWSVIQKVEELPERQKGSSKQVPIGADGRRTSGDPTVLRIGSDPGRRVGAAAGGASRPSCTSARRPDRAVSA